MLELGTLSALTGTACASACCMWHNCHELQGAASPGPMSVLDGPHAQLQNGFQRRPSACAQDQNLACTRVQTGRLVAVRPCFMAYSCRSPIYQVASRTKHGLHT